jgi:hypothetical protein
MHPRWVRWTVIVLAALLAVTLALSAVPSDARPRDATGSGSVVRPPGVHRPAG